jgi:hypothetical protein
MKGMCDSCGVGKADPICVVVAVMEVGQPASGVVVMVRDR